MYLAAAQKERLVETQAAYVLHVGGLGGGGVARHGLGLGDELLHLFVCRVRAHAHARHAQKNKHTRG